MINYTQLVQDVLDGKESALKAYAILKGLKDHIERGINEIKGEVLYEAEKYGESTFSDHGYQFTLKRGATQYSYKGIPEWEAKKDELKDIEDTAKKAYLAAQKGTLVATEDGETIPMPTVTYKQDSVSIRKL